MPKSRHPVDSRLQNKESVISFANQPVVFKFLNAIANGGNRPTDNEVMCVGTRGDGKTIGFMVGAIEHARLHHAAGFPLPVTWMGVTDTFVSHKLKTARSFMNPIWQGGWKLTDQDHTASYWLGKPPVCLVKIDLFGIEDQGAMDKLRMESHGLWFEEPAPSAVMVQSSGISEDAWMLGMTSLRMPTHFHPAVVTMNYPDEDHWTWQRWVTNQAPGTQYFRVPPGERASAKDREDWARALANRPDLLRRLLEGQPGVIMLGEQVAKGFTRDSHTTKEHIPLMSGEPLYFGFDFGHTPTCIIGQPNRATMRIKAALHIPGAGIQQLMEDLVLPWLGRFAPWVLKNPDNFALIGYDPSQGSMEKPKGSEADIDNAALKMIQEQLGGGWFEQGPINWETRKDILVQIFNRAHGVMVEDNQYTQDLIRALDGRWYYAKSHQGDLRSDKPKKPNHPWEDLGDAFVYLLARYGVGGLNENRNAPIQVLTNISIGDYIEPNRRNVVLTNQTYED